MCNGPTVDNEHPPSLFPHASRLSPSCVGCRNVGKSLKPNLGFALDAAVRASGTKTAKKHYKHQDSLHGNLFQ